jgi:hypothetical protein
MTTGKHIMFVLMLLKVDWVISLVALVILILLFLTELLGISCLHVECSVYLKRHKAHPHYWDCRAKLLWDG